MASIYSQKGSVSLFLVIFSALLIVTISTAFIRIMLQDQIQATADDLSKSALDSAYAGVEDAKRAIEYCSDSSHSGARICVAIATVDPTTKWQSDCQAIPRAIHSLGSDGVPITTGAQSPDLDQSYTCLKIRATPDDNEGTINPQQIRVIDLTKKSGEALPASIDVEWSVGGNTSSIQDNSSVGTYVLPQVWPADAPPIIKAQLLQVSSSGFKLSDLDTNSNSNSSLFLLPTKSISPVINTSSFVLDPRLSGSNGSSSAKSAVAQRVTCQTGGSYACKVNITLPALVPAPAATDTQYTYLLLNALYTNKPEQVKVTKYDGSSNKLLFQDSQVVVDSTGRAGDIFRRINSRLDIGMSSFPNPEAAVDTSKSLCKIFSVTNDKVIADTIYMNDSGPCPKVPGT